MVRQARNHGAYGKNTEKSAPNSGEYLRQAEATSSTRIGATAPGLPGGHGVWAETGLAEAVEAGIGIGHLPCFVADARPKLIRLAPPEPEFADDLWLLTHRDLRQSARVRALLDFLAAEIAKMKSLIEGTKPVGGRPSLSAEA